jgi:hypothetical protein
VVAVGSVWYQKSYLHSSFHAVMFVMAPFDDLKGCLGLRMLMASAAVVELAGSRVRLGWRSLSC